MIIAVVVGLVTLSGLALVGLGAYTASRQRGTTSTYIAEDGVTEVHLPAGWSRVEPQSGVDLHANNHTLDESLTVLSELKADYADITLKTYADACVENLKTEIKDARVRGPRALTIGGRPALEYEIEGTFEIRKMGYLVTFVEGAGHFHQIMAWTVKSKFAGKRQKFVDLTDTFRER